MALAWWLSWLKEASSYTRRGFRFGSRPGCWFNPRLGHVQEATDQCLALTLTFLPLSISHSLKSINLSWGRD